MVCIGLIGEIGAGKSTAADYLQKKYNCEKYAFATPLKKACLSLGFEEHELYGTQEQKMETNKIWNISGRKFMQIFGTEICREYLPKLLYQGLNNNPKTDEIIWVKLFNKFVSENLEKNIVIEDVRFADEANAIKKNGGLLIKIHRPSNPHNQTHKKHKSELLNNNIADIHIQNHSIKQLQVELDKIYNTLL